MEHRPEHRLLSAALVAMILQACSSPPPSQEASKPQTEARVAAAGASTLKHSKPDRTGSKPEESLAFEWSANGFEQLPAQYKWTGSGKRDEVFQPNFSLSVPETDDAIWSSECLADGKVKTTVYLAPPEGMTNNRARFKFETDKSKKTLQYEAKYLATGQFDGFEIIQSANDPMFAEMQAGSWAYMQMGEGDKAVKLRISLANASQSLNAFLPACSSTQKQANVPKTSAVQYSCEDGRSVRASYLGNDSETPIVRLEIGGELFLLPQTVSGSGARYESSETMQGDKRRIWLTKGKSGVFIESDANDKDGSTETTVSCQEV
jgi:membrane-bound inhibitor of C-type lysozyme